MQTHGASTACLHGHRVLFYETDAFLVERVCAYLLPALRNGDAAIVAAGAAHRHALDAALQSAGIDIDAATREGRYAAFDAADLLSHVVVGGVPDAGRFVETLAAVVAYLSQKDRKVHVYSELSQCAGPASDDALALEDLWNDLAQAHDFELLCAYPMRSFGDAAGSAAFKRICEQHTSVTPCAGCSMLDGPAEKSREVAQLQQQRTSQTHDREQLRRSDSVLNAAADGIVGINALGTIKIANPAAACMLGYAPEELYGRGLHGLIHHTRPDGTPYPMDECPTYASLSDGEIHLCDADVYWRKDGTSFPVEYTSTPIVEDGRTSGAVVIFRDITDRREAERLKDQFTSVVSHELRTPLTSIRASLGLLESGALGPLPERGRRMVQIAVSNTDRLVRLINDMLDLERIDSSSGAMRHERCDAAELTTSAVEAVRPMATEAGVILVSEARPAVFAGDVDRLVQTLTNLIANAVKFSPPGGRVRITTERSETEILFRVIDEGRGIPADKLERIFERFEQVVSSDARQKGGTGLGLAICRSIVERHAGRIWADSTPGHGATVSFVIPVAREPACNPARVAA
jgi:PAS domain S-box-containing protein